MAAALVFLAAYSVQVIGDVSERQAQVLELIQWITWGAFTVDYAVRLFLAPQRWRWFAGHLPDLAMVVLPVLRPLRLLRLVTLLRVLYGTAGKALRGRIVTFVAVSAVFLTYCASLAVLDAEQHAEGANIVTFGDAVWWSLTTISTVGYGDHYPVTVIGRAVAAALMVSGIAVLGVVTASIGSWLVERVSATATVAVEQADADLRGQLDRLHAEVARLGRMLEESQGAQADRPVGEETHGRRSPELSGMGADE